ncbi:polysaccharide pyruvyl transferase family protein [Dokdonia sp. Asnod3-C12]|uniref:polysaccharide pyruvyl transferase family protein n=1 Tax=Dokdonia sp. Asnod3-C12 TaxID=3160575 RepID=UPI00386AB4D9
MRNSIRLYWWSEIHIQKKKKENYGDLLGKYLVKKISGKSVKWVRANKFHLKNLWEPLYVTIGSVLEHIGPRCTVWGSGINHRDSVISNATFLAVRGPLSRKRLLSMGYACPEVYGDPALLLPLFFENTFAKKTKIGVIPHINDYVAVAQMFANIPEVKVIDFRTNDIESTTKEILSCERIIASSLHGVIVAHAYQIPAVQVIFSDKIFGDGVKYHDYFISVGLDPYIALTVHTPEDVNHWVSFVENHKNALPDIGVIESLQKTLLEVCPFKALNQ